MNRTDEMLERLGRCEARIGNPDALTDRIMESLPERKPLRRERPQRTVAGLVCAFSGMAALWLVGLFVYQMVDTGQRHRSFVASVPAEVEKEYSSSTLEYMRIRGRRNDNTLSYLQLKQQNNEEY